MTPKESIAGIEPEKLSGWALVELFGHQKIVGIISEQSFAGTSFLRVDVPAGADGEVPFTRFYGGNAIYSINPVDEAIGKRLLERHRNVPVSTYDLPQIADKIVKSINQDPDEVPEENEQPIF